MADGDSSNGHFSFGVFELDLAARELRKGGVRIKLQDQPFRVLMLLLERPGEIVTREELRVSIWSEDTFVEFDHGLNTVVQKIRRALGDSATSPRFLETVPKIGYRFIAPVNQAFSIKAESSKDRISAWRVAAGIAIAAVVIGTSAWVFTSDNRQPETIRRVPRQLTTDPGLSAWPDISADGRLVVYSSDRDGGPDLDLWLLNIDRAETVQLTDEPGNEIQPRLSPDGSRVAYASEFDASVYIVTTLGGSRPAKVASGARTPRFSPDGRFLVYTQDNPERGYSASLVVANTDGSEPRRLDSGMRFTGVGSLWLPDGRLLTGGNPRTGRVKDTDWYIVAIDGSAIEPTRAGVRLAQRLEFSRPPPFGPQAWLESEQAVLFSAREGDFIDLWKMPFSLATGRATGPPERFTSGGSAEYDASASSAGRVVYSSLEQNIDLWLLPLDSDGSGQGGPPRRLTTGVGSEFLPRISANGSTIAYLSASSAVNTQQSQVHIAGVSPWRERPTIGPVGSYRNHSLNRDGSEIVYESENDGEPRILSASTSEGAPRRICGDCGRMQSWSPTGRYLIHNPPAPPSQLVAFDTETGRHHVVAEHPRYVLRDAILSPDEHWIAFHAQTRGVLFRQVFLARFQVGHLTKENDWIPLTPPDYNSFRPEWSPDGNQVYYFSNQGGPFAIWRQRLDDATKAPSRAAELVYSGGGKEPSFESDFTSGIGLPSMAVGKDFLIFDAIEKRGNLWLLDPESDR